jgi:hypothetical protein
VNPDVKARWLAALRSGDYEQGTNALKTQLGDQVYHCCLGVLCELAVEAGVTDKVDDGPGRWFFGRDADVSSSVLPRSVIDWSGLTTRDPYVSSLGGTRTTISGLNDAGYSFDLIASVIERQL